MPTVEILLRGIIMVSLFQDSNFLYDWEAAELNNIIEHFFSKLEDDIKK